METLKFIFLLLCVMLVLLVIVDMVIDVLGTLCTFIENRLIVKKYKNNKR